MSSLEPNNDGDVILVNFKLLRNCKIEWVPIFEKYILWIILVLVLCHEMVHILEFKIVRKKRFHASETPFLILPGMTYREVEIASKVRALGDTIKLVCSTIYDLFL